MATSINAAKQGPNQPQRPVKATATTNITISPQLRQAAQAHAAASGGQTIPGINPQDFVAANRIHVKDGSLFIDPYLVIHPRELDPANEATLRQKLALTYGINNPSFFEGPERSAIALNLGQLIPVSAAAKHSRLLEEIKQFNTQVDTGTDAQLTRELQDKKAPFGAIVRDATQPQGNDQVGLELLKNGLAAYLLIREKLTSKNYLGKLTDYVQRTNTPDQVLADLSVRTGITPIAFREAALKGGIDGIGQLLGLDPAYVKDVKQLVDHAAANEFGYNLVEHWHLGRQLQGLQAPLDEKIKVGMDARITAKIDEYRTRVRHHYDVPEPVKAEEKRIADMMNLLDPVERAVMFKKGYEICFTPEVTADDIAFYRGVYGLHRRTANDLRDERGTYRIYFSGHGNLVDSQCTFVHESAHMMWPSKFSAEETQKIDAYANADQKRFGRFQVMLDTHYPEFEKLFKAYQAGNDQEKAAVIQAANQQFAIYDFKAEGLFPYLRDANDFRFAVKHAVDTFSIEGDRYNRSGYNSPEERFREVISRFAEFKQVRFRGEPQFLQFLAPGLNSVWENHYLPHLERVRQELEKGIMPATYAPAIARDEQALAVEPKVEEHPGAPSPKVEERPVPVTSPEAGAKQKSEADAVDAPLNTVQRSGLQITERLLPAINTLQSMGVHI